MAEELNAHKFLLEGLQEIESIESIKLAARVYDSRIGNQNANRIYIFIPDLHIISRKLREEEYTYGFNHERAFVDLLKKLRELRRNQNMYALTVCQLGDFVDLWRENVIDPRDILSNFQGVRDYLYGLGQEWSLNARFLLGNHDAEIAQVPNLSSLWHFRLFFPDENQAKVYVTHGDVFDWVEKLPDDLKRLAVYIFSPFRNPDPKELGELIEVKKNRSQRVDPLRICEPGTLQEVKSDSALPDVHNIKGHDYLQQCFDRVEMMNRDYNLNLTAAVIGHTHEPAISVLEGSNIFFVLMDCGSWQGKYRVNDSASRANCQIGVVCGNDFRIYQLDADINISPQFEPDTVL